MSKTAQSLRTFLTGSILLGAVLTSTAPALAGKSGSIQVKGSDTMVNLVQAWAEAYMARHPEAFIAVTGGGSGTGFAALINGSCDIAVSSREIKKQEVALAAKKGAEPKEFRVALDGLAVVVSPRNPVSQLTLEELSAVFTGRIANWKELGGPDLPIVVLSREVNSGTHVYFKEHVLRRNDPKSKEEFAHEALLLPSSQAIADEVDQNAGAIGYYGMGYIGKTHKALLIAAEKGAEYEAPTLENVISGKYPISRPLYLYTRGEPAGELKKFVDFILSDEGQALVSEVDFVPVKR